MTELLGELALAIVDCEHKTAPEGDGFAYSVGTKAMKDGRLVLDACKPVDAATYEAWTRRMTPAPGDLVLAREAPVGQVVRVPIEPKICLGQRTVLIRPDAERVDPRFLHYWLLGPVAQHLMQSQAAGATVPHLNVADIRGLDASGIPKDRRHQVVVGEVLSAIDDLIENNRRRVEVLEEVARAIYREWFVHFRFPGHEDTTFVDADLGPIPEGWDDRPLFDAADVGFGFAYKSKRFNDEGPFPVIRIRNVPNGTTDTFTDELADEKYRVNDGDILVGMDGEFYVSQWSGGDAWLNQRVARIRPLDGLGVRYLMHAIEGPIRDWNAKIVGTTVAHLGKKHMQQVQVVVPDADTRALSDNVLEPTALLIRDLLQQSRRLAEIRDLLLPRLVTGQIDVSDLDLDAVVEKAGV